MRELTFAEAAEMLLGWWEGKWTVKPIRAPLDASLDDAVDGIAQWFSEDPERRIDGLAEPLLAALHQRILFVYGRWRLEGDVVMARTPRDDDDYLLRWLLDVKIREERYPPEWRPQ